jgi:hypothetical protein
MTPTLHDMTVLLGPFIDGQIITSISVRNQIMLYKHTFGLIPLSSKF